VAPAEFGRAIELDWWLVPVEGGDAVALGVREPFTAAGLQVDRGPSFPYPGTWLADGGWVVFDATTRGGARNLWRIRVSPTEKRVLGEPQKLTAGTGEEWASAAQDGRIAFMNVSDNSDIWSIPIDANRAEVASEPERIISGLSWEGFPSVSADGRKLVYTSDRAGNNDVWLRNLETNEDTQVTVGIESEGRGVISPDGVRVVFRRLEEGKTNVYLTELGRGSERLLLEDIGSHMDFTPDGKKVLFYTNPPLRWKTLDIETGQQQDLGLEHSQDGVASLRFSPDQNWVSFKLANPDSPIFISRVTGGSAQSEDQWIRIADSLGPNSGQTWWAPDGNTLYFRSSRDEFFCIWARSLDPETKKPLGPFTAVQHLHERLRSPAGYPASFGYGLGADKHYLPLSETKANIWLAEPVAEQ
jgi:dipeptidyl aminopeptidase/acylaminoacyl peptidase